MPTINDENKKTIRDPMQIKITVGDEANPYFTFTNEDLISVELNLRSDLKPIDPSLPESELSVIVYSPTDISDQIVNILDDTPVYYTAGYDDDMSTTRKFYVSEPLVWADKTLTIKAVDAVHFLDDPMPACFLGSVSHDDYSPDVAGSVILGQYTRNPFLLLAGLFYDAITQKVELVNIDHSSAPSGVGRDAANTRGFSEEQPRRDLIANMMNLCRFDYDYSSTTTRRTYLTYVDAGIPTYTVNKPTSKWTIYERDCGGIKRNVSRKIKSIVAQNKTIDTAKWTWTDALYGDKNSGMKVGSINIENSQGGNITFDDYAVNACAVIPAAEIDLRGEMTRLKGDGSIGENPKYIKAYGGSTDYGCYMFNKPTYMGWSQRVASDMTLSTFWSHAVSQGVVDSTAVNASFDTYGAKVMLTPQENTYTTTGIGVTERPSKTSVTGRFYLENADDNVIKLLPDMGFKQLLARSNETGSFTWKGDPRMQPRDVFTFVYRDGTEELRTIETISLKHEGGGTVATITYRKGIV